MSFHVFCPGESVSCIANFGYNFQDMAQYQPRVNMRRGVTLCDEASWLAMILDLLKVTWMQDNFRELPHLIVTMMCYNMGVVGNDYQLECYSDIMLGGIMYHVCHHRKTSW